MARGPGVPPRPGAPGQPRLAPGAPGASGAQGSGQCQGLRLSVCLGIGMGTSRCLSLSFGLCVWLARRSAGRRAVRPSVFGKFMLQPVLPWHGCAPGSAPANANAGSHWHSSSAPPCRCCQAVILRQHSCTPATCPVLGTAQGRPLPIAQQGFGEIAGDLPILAYLWWFCAGAHQCLQNIFLEGGLCFSRAKNACYKEKLRAAARNC